jgi:hypothetical protein
MNPYRTALALAIGISASPVTIAATVTGAITGPATIPSDVTEGEQEASDIQLFREATNIELTSDLTVDIASDGTYSGDGSTSSPFFVNDPGDSSVADGTRVDVFLMHRDLIGDNATGNSVTGTITFDRRILGVIVDGSNLVDSESALGFSSSYPPDTSVGTEPNRRFLVSENVDELVLNGNVAELNVQVGGGNVDQARFIVQAIPEPQTIALLPLGLLAMAGLYIQRRMRAARAPQP